MHSCRACTEELKRAQSHSSMCWSTVLDFGDIDIGMEVTLGLSTSPSPEDGSGTKTHRKQQH